MPTQASSAIRVRFAPSPTGFVHVGSLRTALFNFLFARHSGGQLVLRVEDTDQNRLVSGAVENLLSVMKTVGIEFDEGPFLQNGELKQRGAFGPYIQSERKAAGLYQRHAEQLIAQGQAYYCFCSEQRIEEVRKEQTALKKPPMYDRHCRNLAPDEIQKNLEEFRAAGKNPVVRQAIPLDGKTVIHDLIYGDITYDHTILDDQVILKSDGFPTYHLAVVVDDHFMNISHIIRGEEWIPSTPKHILLFAAFGWTPPAFAHMPLVLNPDKSKLSKRQGDVAVEDFLKKGYLPEALVNFVAFLGWNPKTEQEVFPMHELIRDFELTNVNTASPVFDLLKLDWMNSLYIRQLDIETLATALVPHWKNDPIISGSELFSRASLPYLQAVAALERERLKKLSEIGERTRYFFAAPDYDPSLLVWKKSDAADAEKKLAAVAEFLEGIEEKDFSRENLEIVLKDFIAANGGDNGSVLWPLRVALTGLEKSPGPFEVLATLAIGPGKAEIVARLKKAAQAIQDSNITK